MALLARVSFPQPGIAEGLQSKAVADGVTIERQVSKIDSQCSINPSDESE
jgi:hypothetical protein